MIIGAEVKDGLSGKQVEVFAKQVINATGPFTDSLRQMSDPSKPSIIMPSAGVPAQSLPALHSCTTFLLLAVARGCCLKQTVKCNIKSYACAFCPLRLLYDTWPALYWYRPKSFPKHCPTLRPQSSWIRACNFERRLRMPLQACMSHCQTITALSIWA